MRSRPRHSSSGRGPALADLSGEPSLAGEIARLEELRLQALEERIEARLELGRHVQVISELEGPMQTHPLRERLRRGLMLELYRSDRQAEALAAFERAGPCWRRSSASIRLAISNCCTSGSFARTRTSISRANLCAAIGSWNGSARVRSAWSIAPPARRSDARWRSSRSRPSSRITPDFVRRFEREAQIVAKLERPTSFRSTTTRTGTRSPEEELPCVETLGEPARGSSLDASKAHQTEERFLVEPESIGLRGEPIEHGPDLAPSEIVLQPNEHVGPAEISVVLGDLVLEDQVVTEGVPGQVGDRAVVLMSIVSVMREYEIRLYPSTQCIEELLELGGVWEVALAERCQFYLVVRSAREEQRRSAQRDRHRTWGSRTRGSDGRGTCST